MTDKKLNWAQKAGATQLPGGITLTYNRDNSKNSINNLLKLNPDHIDEWSITDEVSDLQLIHYNGNPRKSLYPLRGVIIDKKKNVIVARTNGLLPTVKASSIDSTSEYADIYDDTKYKIPSNASLSFANDGAVIRIYKHDKIHFSSYRKIDAYHTTWGTGQSFGELYSSLGGPDAEKLFPAKCSDSCLSAACDHNQWCYFFNIISPQLYVGSMLPVKKGFIIYMGREHRESGETKTDIPTYMNDKSKVPAFDLVKCNSYTDLLNMNGGITLRPNLTLDEANHILKNGYSKMSQNKDSKVNEITNKVSATNNDERLSYGEFINVEFNNMRLIVASPAYLWRKDLRSGYQDPKAAIYSCIDDSKLDDEKYKAKYPTIVSDKYENIIKCLEFALPQFECKSIADMITTQKQQVCAWMMSIKDKHFNMQFNTARVQQMIKAAYGRARVVAFNGDKHTEAMRKELSKFMDNERGSSFYNIYCDYMRLK